MAQSVSSRPGHSQTQMGKDQLSTCAYGVGSLQTGANSVLRKVSGDSLLKRGLQTWPRGLGERETTTGRSTGRQLSLDIMGDFPGVRAAAWKGWPGPRRLPDSSHGPGTHCKLSGARPRLCMLPRALQTFGTCEGGSECPRQRQRLQNEWKMAKIELLVILLFVLSWAPYSTVALMGFAG